MVHHNQMTDGDELPHIKFVYYAHHNTPMSAWATDFVCRCASHYSLEHYQQKKRERRKIPYFDYRHRHYILLQNVIISRIMRKVSITEKVFLLLLGRRLSFGIRRGSLCVCALTMAVRRVRLGNEVYTEFVVVAGLTD